VHSAGYTKKSNISSIKERQNHDLFVMIISLLSSVLHGSILIWQKYQGMTQKPIKLSYLCVFDVLASWRLGGLLFHPPSSAKIP
jgi:hypothetical protein